MKKHLFLTIYFLSVLFFSIIHIPAQNYPNNNLPEYINSLSVISDPPSATLYVDNISVGLTPYIIYNVSVGNHYIKLIKPSYYDYTSTVYVGRGNNSFYAVLTPLNQTPQNQTYLRFTITSEPSEAQIYIDGRYMGLTPSTINLTLGEHVVVIKKEGYNDFRRAIYLNGTYNNTLNVFLIRKNQTGEGEEGEGGKIRVRGVPRDVVAGSSGCVIRIEKEINIENGRRVEEIKRRIECENGLEKEIIIRIDNSTRNGRIVEIIKYKEEDDTTNEIEVEAEEKLDLEEFTNESEYRLKVRCRVMNVTSNLSRCSINTTDIKIMPDDASQIALERLRLRVCSKENNCSIQLREKIHKNIPRVVYNIETNKNGKFLGIFKITMRANVEVDSETGEVLEAKVPWWAFLVSQKDETEGTLVVEVHGEENQTSGNNQTKPIRRLKNF